MPAVAAFLRGFSLTKKLSLAGYNLTDIQSDHVVVETYRRYQFPLILTFQTTSPNPDIDSFAAALHQLLSQHHTINSQYGNPYGCYFLSMEYQSVSADHRTVVIKALGEGVRI